MPDENPTPLPDENPSPLPDWARAQERRAVRQWAVGALQHLPVNLPEGERWTLPGFLDAVETLARFIETGEISRPSVPGEG